MGVKRSELNRLAAEISRLEKLAAPSYKDYVERKKDKGEKPLSRKEWESFTQGGGSGGDMKTPINLPAGHEDGSKEMGGAHDHKVKTKQKKELKELFEDNYGMSTKGAVDMWLDINEPKGGWGEVKESMRKQVTDYAKEVRKEMGFKD